MDGMKKEGKIYKWLESNYVPNIAPFGKGNDVHDYTTLTHMLRDKKWACWSRDMVLLRHYQMSLDIVTQPLTSFSSLQGFVGVIADAMLGKISFADFTHVTNSLLP